MGKTVTGIDERDDAVQKKVRRMSMILGALVILNMLIVAAVLSWRL